MTYDVIVGGKTYKFNTQKEQEDFINQGYINHNRMYVGNNIALTSKPDNKPLLDPNKTYNAQLSEVEVTNGQTKIQNTGHNDPIISQIFQGNYFGKKFVPTEQNISHYLNLYKGDKQNNEKFAPKEWMKVGGMHLLAGAAIPTIATAPIATAIGAAGGYASDWLWRNYTGKSFGDNVLDWTGLQNYSNPYIDSDMIRDAADALEPLAFFTGGLGVDDITGKYITNKLIPRTKNNLAGAAMRFNTTDNVMAPSEDLMFRPINTIKQGANQQDFMDHRQFSLVGHQDGIPQYVELENPVDNSIVRRYITRPGMPPMTAQGSYRLHYPRKDELYLQDRIPYGEFPFIQNGNSYQIIEVPDDRVFQNYEFNIGGPSRRDFKYDEDNYHTNSFGVFTPIKELPSDAEFLYRSPGRRGYGGSTYWKSKDGKTLYRESDHWGDGIKYSSWYLKGDECPGGHCGNTFEDVFLGAIKFSDLKSNDYYSDPNINSYNQPTKFISRHAGPEEYVREYNFSKTLLMADKKQLSNKLDNIYITSKESNNADFVQEQINILESERDNYNYNNSIVSWEESLDHTYDVYELYDSTINKLQELLDSQFLVDSDPQVSKRRINQGAEELEDDSFVAPPKRRRIRRNQEVKEIEENIE